jgi:hypothetical protein
MQTPIQIPMQTPVQNVNNFAEQRPMTFDGPGLGKMAILLFISSN